MKRTLPYLFFLASALLTNFFAQRVMAQATTAPADRPGTLTTEQVVALKALKIS